MLLQILGTAAGGGVPQWNCACPGCAGARSHPERRRRHASAAVRAGDRWFVINATPDIADQVEFCGTPAPGSRATPLAGVILTDAELDHTLGLARLREAASVEVIATPAVAGALSDRLRLNDVLAPYTRLAWHELPEDRPLRLGGAVTVRAVRVSGKRPRYAADASADGAWSVALVLADGDRTAVYAPCVADWSPALDKVLGSADCVIIDGTFWDDDEPRRMGISDRTATQMGHLPITWTAGPLSRLPARRRLYTHLNNTNPLVDPTAPAHASLAALGIEVAPDRTVIEL
ncbi:pyrroloquinoline quinone biosynthesis protein PqqB [Actinoallomurus rhizosphaericola]|uniref:pyrroloquinoline quinone biosynthesis protein PqqB n=1 Tax=Actinoallomurus rhizosphaericola TaxID=2952536 RepID=UPI00209317B3|nr:MBL fold metallo-hydrolase [Actinoallomurus rhizosphaericola]MCO5998300.1 MBL fold metallo-hydrolase [Actinoallomurus rhizosphaericola]